MTMSARFLIPFFLMGSVGLSPLAAQSPAVAKVVETYCSDCHNGSMQSASHKVLEQFDASQIKQQPEVWADVYRQLQAGAMPPFGASRPDRATYAAALTSIEKELE